MYSLNCYQCDSNTNPDCTEFFDHDNVDTLTIRSTECKVDASEFCIKKPYAPATTSHKKRHSKLLQQMRLKEAAFHVFYLLVAR